MPDAKLPSAVAQRIWDLKGRILRSRLAALKQMTDLLVLSIVIPAVLSEEPVHHATHRIVQHLSQQMDVIGHQAVSVKVEGTFGFRESRKARNSR